MGKYYGAIGYAIPTEIRPGVWEDVIVERRYFGDISKDTAKWRQGEYLHNDLSAANVISVVADAYAVDHIYAMRYIEWSGTFWSVADVVVERPRLNIRLGKVYNGPKADGY